LKQAGDGEEYSNACAAIAEFSGPMQNFHAMNAQDVDGGLDDSV
jgi:hypothetical protein